jgi:hypothetical protein
LPIIDYYNKFNDPEPVINNDNDHRYGDYRDHNNIYNGISETIVVLRLGVKPY